MKKTIYFVLIMQLTLTACQKTPINTHSFEAFLEEWAMLTPYQDVCTSATDAIKLPENWTEDDLENFVISDETVRLMSTCGLLITLLEHPTNRMTGPWCTHCSSLELPGITMFNDRLRADRIAIELFTRNDCFAVLASKYLHILKEDRESNFQIQYFEMLLASDLSMVALSKKERILLMAMALERQINKDELFPGTPYIMIAIMKFSDYAPFMKEVSPFLIEGTLGYRNLNDYDIVKYVKLFLNDKKELL